MESIVRSLISGIRLLRIGKRKPEKASARPHVLVRISGKRIVRQIGKAYLQKAPHENDAGFLEELIAGGRDTAVQPDEKIKQDFASGNIVVIRGWIISITEARMCALQLLTE